MAAKVDICLSCERSLAPVMFLEASAEPEEGRRIVCDHCRQYGPPVKWETEGLSVPWLKAITALASGAKIREAARAAGLDEQSLRRMMEGTENKAARNAFKRLLVNVGLGPDKAARILNDAASAMKHLWNARECRFEEFPDHAARMNAAKTAIKTWGFEEPKEIPSDAPRSVTININTNFDSDEPVNVPGKLVARAHKKSDAIDVEAT